MPQKTALGATGGSIAYVCALSEAYSSGDSDGALAPGSVILPLRYTIMTMLCNFPFNGLQQEEI
jgi:hypothetical protein